MTLEQQLQAYQAEWTKNAPEGRAALYQSKIDDLRRSGIEQGALKIGQQAPAFQLADAAGNTVGSPTLLKQGPLVVTFYRGGWCPYCNLQLRAYQAVLPELERHGARLVAISPEQPDQSLSTVEKGALRFSVLSDTGNIVARSFGLVYTLPIELQTVLSSVGKALPAINGDDSWELPVPATFVIRPDGEVALAHIDVDYRRRLSPDMLVSEVARLV